MAFVAVKIDEFVTGGRKRQIWKGTFTGVTAGAIATGLNQILHANITEQTTEGQGVAYKNFSDTGTTAKAGSLYIDGATASDVMSIEVVGY